MDWRKALQQPYGQQRLTELMARAWLEQPLVEDVFILDCLLLRVILKRDESKAWNVPLGPLWTALRVHRRRPPAWTVQRFVQHWLSAFDLDLEVQFLDVFSVYPILEDDSWQQVVKSSDGVAEAVTKGLWLGYQIERDAGAFYLNHKHLSALKLNPANLKACAFGNLRRRYAGGAALLAYGNNIHSMGLPEGSLYSAVALVQDRIWHEMTDRFQIRRLLAAVPCYCHVFFTDAAQADSVRAFMAKVNEVFETTEFPLSQVLLARENNAWVPYREKPLRLV